MNAVYRKEMMQYHNSLAGSVFLAAYVALTDSLWQQNGDASRLFESILSALMFLVPLLTMRLFAEKKKARTDQTLFTAPVSDARIVRGKFGAAATMFGLGSLPVLLNVAVLAYYGGFEPLAVAGNVIALALAGMAFIAVGLFAFALTDNQVMAAIVSYAALLGLWLLGYAQPYLPEWAQAAVAHFSYRSHVQELAAGIFSLSAFVYFGSLTGLMPGLLTPILCPSSKSPASIPCLSA